MPKVRLQRLLRASERRLTGLYPLQAQPREGATARGLILSLPPQSCSSPALTCGVDGPVWSLTLIRSWASKGTVSDEGEMSVVTLGCRIENLPVVSLKIPHSSCGPNRSDAWCHGKGGKGEMGSLRSRSKKREKEENRVILWSSG